MSIFPCKESTEDTGTGAPNPSVITMTLLPTSSTCTVGKQEEEESLLGSKQLQVGTWVGTSYSVTRPGLYCKERRNGIWPQIQGPLLRNREKSSWEDFWCFSRPILYTIVLFEFTKFFYSFVVPYGSIKPLLSQIGLSIRGFDK